MTLLEISAEVMTVAIVLMLSWRIMRRGSSDQRSQHGVVSRQWLMEHDAEEHR
jgi:hypothetical protein